MFRSQYPVATLLLSFLVLPAWAGEERVRIEPGSLTMTNVTLITCLMDAYRIYARAHVDAFGADDITSKAAGPIATDQVRLMLQALLAERFHMTLHHEQKELNVSSLAPGKRGHNLREATQPGDKAMEMDSKANTL